MSATLNLSLTDELREFINQNSGDGSLYATPSEFVRALLREKKERMEAAELREGIIAGLSDIATGRTIEFNGSIQSLLNQPAEPAE